MFFLAWLQVETYGLAGLSMVAGTVPKFEASCPGTVCGFLGAQRMDLNAFLGIFLGIFLRFSYAFSYCRHFLSLPQLADPLPWLSAIFCAWKSQRTAFFISEHRTAMHFSWLRWTSLMSMSFSTS